MEEENPQIGKDVIESLTLGMYEDSRFIFREYIQNSADSIDKAINEGVLKRGEEEIHVNLDSNDRSITIEDNAMGISKINVVPILRNIAHSTKTRGKEKGFRGIGRLGGLGYCSKLIFETSYKGEPVKSTMTWDADLFKLIINDREKHEEAVDVIKKVTSCKQEKEDIDKHYFKVTLLDVTSDDLLDSDNVCDYLSMVAPVDIASKFIYRSQIVNFMKENGLSVDTYNIYFNGEQIYKPYTSCIYEASNGGKKKVDDILGVNFLLQKDDNDEIMYWGWYTLSRLNGQMKPINLARGIRLRKENIQIGDEEICKKFFTKTEDQRFSFYYFGEIHAVSKGLIPNSRRDYFGESPECSDFEKRIKLDFLNLKDICYDAQKYRTSINTIVKSEEFQKTVDVKSQKGFTSKQEKEDLYRQLEEHKAKAEQAKKQLDNVKKKIESSDSPLKGILDKMKPENKGLDISKPVLKTIQTQTKTKFRTDAPIYSCYSKREKKLIGKIYAAITNAIPDEKQREALISKIEEEITK